MKRFKINYDIDIKLYDKNLLIDEPHFEISLYENVWDWLKFKKERNCLITATNQNIFICIQHIKNYIDENNLNKKKTKCTKILKDLMK